MRFCMPKRASGHRLPVRARSETGTSDLARASCSLAAALLLLPGAAIPAFAGGPPCTTDADCTDPARPQCMAGVCEGLPIVCQSDADCSDPTRPQCDSGTCQATSGACASNLDCADPAFPFCAAGSCSRDSGVSDHMMCFGIRDSARIKAQLQVDTPQFGAFDCKIAKKSIELCVPARKLLGELRDVSTRPHSVIDPLAIGGTPVASNYLCYALKCKRPWPAEQAVIDQFAVRLVDKFRAKKLCVPAEALIH